MAAFFDAKLGKRGRILMKEFNEQVLDIMQGTGQKAYEAIKSAYKEEAESEVQSRATSRNRPDKI